MSNAPWTIQKSKRKQPSTTPAPRKRARFADDVGTERPSSARRRNQQTLTQIQWVKSPEISLNDDLGLQEIDVEDRSDAGKPRRTSRGLTKQDSTLTQMNWLGGGSPVEKSIVETMEMLPEHGGPAGPHLFQVDGGAHSSPMKRKKQKSDNSPKPLRSSSPQVMEPETQDYLPTKRRKKDLPTGQQKSGVRRRSERIASKVFPDPDENSEHIHKSPAAQDSSHEMVDVRVQPSLEEMEPLIAFEERTPTQADFPPQTPTRRREIPSSQTPETISRRRKISTNQDVPGSLSKKTVRTPLRERSINVPSKSYFQGLKSAHSMLTADKTTSKRSKICVLKVPSRHLLQRTSRVEDSQHDLYSLPLTSSSDDVREQQERSGNQKEPFPKNVEVDESVEIPPTSQMQSSSDHDMPSSPPGTNTDGSLPQLTDLIPSRNLAAVADLDAAMRQRISHHQASNEDSIVVQDFGRPIFQMENVQESHSLPQKHNVDGQDGEVMLLDSETRPKTVPLQAESKDNDSDFGSPIANDTQFNVGLFQRTSSPDLATQSKEERSLHQNEAIDKITTPSRSRSGKISAVEDSEEETDLEMSTPIPTPRLVDCPSSSSGRVQSDWKHAKGDSLNLPLSSLISYKQHSTRKLPLNDTLQASSSSSPLLPPTKVATQGSIRPAAMPRPSQMSTQDPTQHYHLSSMPPPTQHHDIERITIKDSSSIRMSQIPQHETQSQGLDLQLVNQSDEEIDDLDLDPSSHIRGNHSARKPFTLPRKETGSSLRSIHVSSDSDHHDRATSPLHQRESTKGESARRNIRRNMNQCSAIHQDRTAADNVVYDSDGTSSPVSSPVLPPLKRKYDPLPGFDNETQSNFTQDGHITAAYIHRQRETGAWPEWFIPDPVQVLRGKRST